MALSYSNLCEAEKKQRAMAMAAYQGYLYCASLLQLYKLHAAALEETNKQPCSVLLNRIDLVEFVQPI